MRKSIIAFFAFMLMALPALPQSRQPAAGGTCSIIPPDNFSFSQGDSNSTNFASKDGYFVGTINFLHADESFESFVDRITKGDGQYGGGTIYYRERKAIKGYSATRLSLRGGKKGITTFSCVDAIDLGRNDYIVLTVITSQPDYLLVDVENIILSGLYIDMNRVSQLTGRPTEAEVEAQAETKAAASSVARKKYSDALFSMLLLFFKEEVGIVVPSRPAYPGQFGLALTKLSKEPFSSSAFSGNMSLADEKKYEGVMLRPLGHLALKDFDISYLCFPESFQAPPGTESIVEGPGAYNSTISANYPFLAGADNPAIMPEATKAVLAVHGIKEPALSTFLRTWYAIAKEYRSELVKEEERIKRGSGDYRSAGFRAAIPQLGILAAGAGLAGFGLYQMSGGLGFEKTWGWTVLGGGLVLLGAALTGPTHHDADSYRRSAIELGLRALNERYTQRYFDFAKQFEAQFPGQLAWVERL